MTLSSVNHSACAGHNCRSHATKADQPAAASDGFTASQPEEANPMAELAKLRRTSAEGLYGNNAGQTSGIEREDFPCMGPAFICYSCG